MVLFLYKMKGHVDRIHAVSTWDFNQLYLIDFYNWLVDVLNMYHIKHAYELLIGCLYYKQYRNVK